MGCGGIIIDFGMIIIMFILFVYSVVLRVICYICWVWFEDIRFDLILFEFLNLELFEKIGMWLFE